MNTCGCQRARGWPGSRKPANAADDWICARCAKLLGPEARLCAEWKQFCLSEDLPYLSADDLLREGSLNAQQKAYIYDFIDRWEQMWQATAASRNPYPETSARSAQSAPA